MGGGWRVQSPAQVPPARVESRRVSRLALAALAALVVVGVMASRRDPRAPVDGFAFRAANETMTEFDAGAKVDAGAKGDAGPAGAQGPKGDAGPAGAQGPKGDAGPAGAKGAKGDTGAKGDAGRAGAQGPKGVVCANKDIVPMRTQHAPNLAWLCPLCTCAAGKLCDAIHARATKLITNFRAACTLCPTDSETAESILASTETDVLFLDVAYPFRSVDTCGAAGGAPLHTCVLCDNVTGVEPNCGVDNLGKMRDLRVTAERDVDCRSGRQAQCACVHAEELTPVSWAECAAIVHRAHLPGSSELRVAEYLRERMMDSDYAVYPHAGLVLRYHGYVEEGNTGYAPRAVGTRIKLDGGIYTFPRNPSGRRRACFYDESCRPARFLLTDVPAAKAALADKSVAAAIAEFYATDADAAGHAAIKAVCRARGAGTTCGGLSPLHAKTSREFAMLVQFAPITSEGTWLQPVVLFSV